MPWIATKSVPGVALSATTRKCDTVHHVSEAGGAHLLPCGGARDLQVHVIAVVRQVALLPEGDAGAVGARVVAPLQVHRIDVCRQAVLLPECDAGAVVARVVAQLQVHRIDVRLQVALLPGGDAGRGSRGTRGRAASSAPHRCESSGSASLQRRRRGSTAVGARVVAPLRVHRVEVPRQVALRLESDALAVGARVRPHLLVDGRAVPPHVAHRAEAAAAVRALVVAPPLVHRPAVLHHVALPREEAALRWGHLLSRHTQRACLSRSCGD